MVDRDTNEPANTTRTSAPAVSIHPLVTADLPVIATLYVAAIRDDELLAFLWPYLDTCLERFRIYSLTKLKQQWNSSDTCMFVAKVDGNTVGFAAWKRIGDRGGGSWLRRRNTSFSVCKFSHYSLGGWHRSAGELERCKSINTLTYFLPRRYRDVPPHG